MELNFSAVGHALGAFAYFITSILVFMKYRRRLTDRALIAACAITAVWLVAIALQSLGFFSDFYVRYGLEILRNGAWFTIITLLMGVRLFPHKNIGIIKYRLTLFVQSLLVITLFITIASAVFDIHLLSDNVLLFSQIAIALIGLVLIEQIWRSTSTRNRASIKYLIVALAFMFGYDFYMYSDALLFRQIDPNLWAARGIINLVVAPLIAVILINSRQQPVEVQISRQVIFHTGTLLIAGTYLIIASLGGYYLRIFGGSWGEVIQILFLFAAFLGLVILLSSPGLRARMMIFISKNFFNYKYDYREEWLKSMRTLTREDGQLSLQQRAIQSLADIMQCRSGLLWYKNENNFELSASLNMNTKKSSISSTDELISYFQTKNWVIDLNDYAEDPTRYQLLVIPDEILNLEKPWLIIPLFLTHNLKGFIVLCDPVTKTDLNWENYDLLKIVAKQCCIFLEQDRSQKKLSESKQFEAVNQTSAFMIHDLKTVVAQLSLMVKNAEKHKTNPAFVDDMIRTTGHTVDKITYLLQQLKKPQVGKPKTQVDLVKLLREIENNYQNALPKPNFQLHEKQLNIRVNKDEMASVIGHIIQNAIDATAKDGEVTIILRKSNDFAVLFIQDTGSGMTQAFIDNELFKPFVSTKGVSGMGVGAYQSQQYLRKIGGEIDVTSEKGNGTCFTLKIPIAP